MTWNKTVPSSTYVLAHRGGRNNDEVRVAVGMAGAELSAADATSLGEYLIEKAEEIRAEALGRVVLRVAA